MTTKTKAPEQTEIAEVAPEVGAEPDVVRIDPTEGYRAAAQVAQEEGRTFQSIDQRTGRVMGSGNPTAAQRQAELRSHDAAEEAKLDEFIETIRLAVGDVTPYGASSKAVDVRKAKDQLRAALERVAAQQEDPDRAALAARALQRLDGQAGVVKRSGPSVTVW